MPLERDLFMANLGAGFYLTVVLKVSPRRRRSTTIDLLAVCMAMSNLL